MQEFFEKALKDMVNIMYLCKIASFEEMNRKWDYEIEHHVHNRRNWTVWKQHSLENFQKGHTLPYYGILDGNIICEATAMLNPGAVQNSEELVGDGAVYLSAFRTIEEHQGKGFFSKLIKFIKPYRYIHKSENGEL